VTDDLARRVRSLLRHPVPGAYLNSAAEGLPLDSAGAAYERYLDAKSRGSSGRAVFDEIEDDARLAFAGLLAVPPADIAFVASTSRGFDAVVKSIEWMPGDSIVVPLTEFPTALFAARLLETRGIVVRSVGLSADGTLDEDAVIAAIDDTTRLVVASVVSFRTGQRLHTHALVARAHELGALVFLDAVQALGSVAFEVGDADFVCAASFKWLLGLHGAAGLYVNPRTLSNTRPPYVGYRSVVDLFPPPPASEEPYPDARRYEEGLPDYGALAVLHASLQQLAGLRDEIVHHNREVTARLRDGLLELGAAVLAPDAPRGSIVAFETPKHAEIARTLSDAGTTVWARDGRVRLSPHAYTTEDDVATALRQLEQIGLA
jgi:cysteine desulfurase/selenocysteine lyase